MFHHIATGFTRRTVLTACLSAWCCLALPFFLGSADAKRKPAYRPQPDLKILSIGPSPLSYAQEQGSLDMTIEVELPNDVDGATILEVSSLISSPSKRSMRFLSNRQAVGAQASLRPGTASPDAKPRVIVTLTWDGTDQSRQAVERGIYSYEIRAKLLTGGEKGPRTRMVSWPKRGTLEVK